MLNVSRIVGQMRTVIIYSIRLDLYAHQVRKYCNISVSEIYCQHKMHLLFSLVTGVLICFLYNSFVSQIVIPPCFSTVMFKMLYSVYGFQNILFL
jgi:hypothetical protein